MIYSLNNFGKILSIEYVCKCVSIFGMGNLGFVLLNDLIFMVNSERWWVIKVRVVLFYILL